MVPLPTDRTTKELVGLFFLVFGLLFLVTVGGCLSNDEASTAPEETATHDAGKDLVPVYHKQGASHSLAAAHLPGSGISEIGSEAKWWCGGVDKTICEIEIPKRTERAVINLTYDPTTVPLDPDFYLVSQGDAERVYADDDHRIELSGDQASGHWNLRAWTPPASASFAWGGTVTYWAPNGTEDLHRGLVGHLVGPEAQLGPHSWCSDDCSFNVPEGVESLSVIWGHSGESDDSFQLVVSNDHYEEPLEPGFSEIRGDNLAGDWSVEPTGPVTSQAVAWYANVDLEEPAS